MGIDCNKNHCTCFIDSCCGKDWHLACKMHDKRYANKRLTRKQADELLRRSVLKQSGSAVLARVMYIGVRILGWYWYSKESN